MRTRLLHDESGIALIMALGIMLILTAMLTTVIFLTSAGARDASRSNSGQKAYGLAQAGLANALAVLNANYPGTTTFPGDPTLLTPPVTSTYSTGTATWSGTLVTAPSTANWTAEWHITSTGDVKNPTGPGTADTTRTLTAVVPVVIPTSSSIDPTHSSLDFVYSKLDMSFGQSMNVRSPIYATRDLTLSGTAVIDETIPASATGPARQNKIAVGRDFLLGQPSNQAGQIDSPTPGNLAEVHVVGNCSWKNNAPHSTPCTAADKVFATVSDNTIPPGFVVPPTLTCCAPFLYGNGVDGTGNLPPVTVPPTPSYMGFWYKNADLGPNKPCGPGMTGSPPNFDTSSGVADGSINQSAYSLLAPFNLTPLTSYTCKSASGAGELSWNVTTSTLTIKGNIFIDGSVTATKASGSIKALYTGLGTLILGGGFSMTNHDALCVNLTVSGNDCDPLGPWDPNAKALAIVAYGVFADAARSGSSINVKDGEFQGLVVGNADVVCAPASNTLIQGPMVSVHGNVSCGQSGELRFPAIAFASSGTDGLTGPLPLPQLLAPTNFGGG